MVNFLSLDYRTLSMIKSRLQILKQFNKIKKTFVNGKYFPILV